MTWCSVDKATPRFDLASSAIRCRFVYRFSRPKVLSHVARQRFSPRGTPLSSVGSQRAWFPDVVGRTEVLRLPTHAFPVAYLVRFRVPHDPSGQDPCSAGDPSYPAFSSRGREWDLSDCMSLPQMRRLTLDVATRVTRMGRAEPQTRRVSRETSYRSLRRNRYVQIASCNGNCRWRPWRRGAVSR